MENEQIEPVILEFLWPHHAKLKRINGSFGITFHGPNLALQESVMQPLVANAAESKER